MQGRHASFITAAQGGTCDNTLFECYLGLGDLLSCCFGTHFGLGVNVLHIRSDVPVPKKYIPAFAKISRQLHRMGGKTRFRVNGASGFMVKSYLDLYKRIIERLFPVEAGRKCGLLKVQKPKKIRVGPKREQKYLYSYVWDTARMRSLLGAYSTYPYDINTKDIIF